MRVFIRRDGLHVTGHHKEGDTLVFTHRRFPRFPLAYGNTLAIEADAYSADTENDALMSLVRNAIATDKALREKKRKPLKLSTLQIIRVEPTAEDGRTMLSWKATE